ncbi:MAG TPA: molybdopterin-guanine dinucleotide biosynthesis protein MobB [Thermodesulfovibrionales bacterium]|nr:molybdopterin-guanine dinucleotide biosynthesis protein MobB [Thermodesulfovibrionales bacterium]
MCIGIGASHSGSGKTTLASKILRHFTSRPPYSVHRPLLWGAIKYTRTSLSPEVISDRNVLRKEGKDTRVLLDAGAEDVVWVRSGRAGLMTALSDAVTRLLGMDVLVIEGNSAIEFLQPDIVIFIFSKERERWKPDIEKLAATADIVFSDDDVQLPAGVQPRFLFPRDLPDNKSKGFFSALARMVNERRTKTRVAREDD